MSYRSGQSSDCVHLLCLLQLLFEALENERFSYDGKHFQIGDSGIVPRPDRKFRVFLGGTSDRTYELAAERGWAVVVPR